MDRCSRAGSRLKTASEGHTRSKEESRWDEMFEKLAHVRLRVGDNLTVKTMVEWAPVVARYSFASGRLLVADTRSTARGESVH